MKNGSDLEPLRGAVEASLGRASMVCRAAASGSCEALLRLAQMRMRTDVASGRLRFTPLHYAATFGHPSATYLLCRLGADLGRTGMGGLSPMGLAARSGHGEVVEVLLAWEASLKSERLLLSAAYHNCGHSTALQLIRRGVLKFASKREICEVLDKCCRNQELTLVSAILSSRIDINLFATRDYNSDFSFERRSQYPAEVQKFLFEHQLKMTEPVTPLVLKGASAVQRRYYRRSRSL